MARYMQGTYPIKISTKEYPHFSDRLKIAMHLRNCSVEELAHSSFLTHSTVSNYRTGKREPSLATLFLIAKTLDVSSDFLLGLTEYIYI